MKNIDLKNLIFVMMNDDDSDDDDGTGKKRMTIIVTLRTLLYDCYACLVFLSLLVILPQ